jgi:UDP-N-acetylmuramoylalanine--D-glutamate ligase
MFTRDFFAGKRVTVMGLGLNEGGVGTVRFLATLGVREIIVTDLKTESELAPSLRVLKLVKGVRYVLGEHQEKDFIETDLVIKTPGLPWTNPFIKTALAHGVPVTMDSGLFFDLCEAPIIGVTGTKGKTTTASLIAHLLEKAGKKVVRVGISQVSVLGELEKVDKESVVVFELSSWRLSVLSQLHKSPTVAVITNIYPDHQNYYANMEEYVEDKKNIFRFQSGADSVVLNGDNTWTQSMAGEARGNVVWFSGTGQVTSDGFSLRGDRLVLTSGGQQEEIATLAGTRFVGAHNRENAVAAVAAVRIWGIDPAVIQAGLLSFEGVPHRLELVGEKRGIRFYNDSAATIPEAAMAALESFTKPVYLIVGGSDKNLDFGRLACVILERAKGVIFLKGAGTDKLLAELRARLMENGLGVWRFEVVESMGKAVELATRSAEEGDIVLLSPGTASFGLFKNEFDRGDQFRQYVNELPEA